MMSDEDMNELQRAVGRIEGKLDALLESDRGHEKRISGLEKWRAWTAGIAVAIGTALSVGWEVFHK